MAKTVHDIDPNADAVLILRNPNFSFALWCSDEAEPNAAASAERDFNTETSNQVAPSSTSSCEPNSVDCYALGEEIQYRVSSRHLTLASPVFKSMLLGKTWNEGIRNEIDGLYHVPAEDWDAEALLVLLEVLHNRNRRVPRTVSLELLAKLAVLIDYYKCAEALESFTERWTEHLKGTCPVPSYFCRDLMLWMCVAWVLKLPEEFAQTTTVAVRRDGKDLSSFGLPIVRCVARIEEDRMRAIGTVFSQLQALVDEYRSQSYVCPNGESFECGSILFGALTKQMELQGLLPVPTTPFASWSISELYTKLQRIRSPSWSSPRKPKKNKHSCDLSARVMAIADSVTRLADGPRLEDLELR